MKNVLVLVCLLGLGLLVSCTSMVPVSQDRQELVDKIQHGQLLLPGEVVEVTTDSGASFKMTVDRVEGDFLYAKDGRSVEIEQIVSVQKQKVDAGKTAGLTLGISAGALLLIGIILSSIVFIP